jgi:hypothetical protein
MWRTPKGSGSPGGSGGPGGTGRPGGPRGGGPGPTALAVPAGNQPALNPNDRIMGSLPQLFDGDCKLARAFLDQLTSYFQANSHVPGRSYVKHVLDKLMKHNLFLRPEKCAFEQTSIEFLGVRISQGEVQMNDTKVEKVCN